jgi:hypothetical protein
LAPDLVPLIDAVTPDMTVLIAFWTVAFGGVALAGAADEFPDEGPVGDAQAETSASAPITRAMFLTFMDGSCCTAMNESDPHACDCGRSSVSKALAVADSVVRADRCRHERKLGRSHVAPA